MDKIKLAKGDNVMVVGFEGRLAFFDDHRWSAYIGRKGKIVRIRDEDGVHVKLNGDKCDDGYVFKSKELKYLLSYKHTAELRAENEELKAENEKLKDRMNKPTKGDQVKIVGNREGELSYSFSCYIGETVVVSYKYNDGDYAVIVSDGSKILVAPHEIEPVESSEVAELKAENEKLKTKIREVLELRDYWLDLYLARSQTIKQLEGIINNG